MSAIVHIPISEEKKQQWVTKKLPALLYFAYAVLVVLSVNNGFFWDSILLASRYGQWYYDSNFTTLFVPENIAGYPPLFGMLVAFAWKILGRNLVVSHFLMLPFVLGIVYQVLRLSRKFLPERTAPWVALLVLADPTLLAQCTQVAPDIILVFLYLFSLNEILGKRRKVLVFSLLFLGILSPRGFKAENNGQDVEIKSDFLEVPFLFVFNPFDHFSFHIGPQAGVLLTVKENERELGESTKDRMNSFVYGAVGGIEGRLSIARLGARYHLGLYDIYKEPSTVAGRAVEDLKNGQFQVYVGVGF